MYIGLRDVDEAERKILREHGILAFSMYHVDKYGIGGVMERTLEHLQHRPLHLRSVLFPVYCVWDLTVCLSAFAVQGVAQPTQIDC